MFMAYIVMAYIVTPRIVMAYAVNCLYAMACVAVAFEVELRNQEKEAAVQLMNYLKSNLTDLQVGAIQFSGPTSCDDYDKAIGCTAGYEPGYAGPKYVEIQVSLS